MKEELIWQKFKVGSDGFVCLVDVMGDDAAICDAARISYGKGTKSVSDNRSLIRYLYRHGHLTPLEMCEAKFIFRVPMDILRQIIRHRTAHLNELSTRYSIAIDSAAEAQSWREQSKTNKQGSDGEIYQWPEDFEIPAYIKDDIREGFKTAGPKEYLSFREAATQEFSREVYEERLRFGIAREQARKDLPLSTYTELYWKCDLRNILNFLSLRMDAHAQLEIREIANVIYDICKQLFPLTIEAFDDYDFRRGGLLLSAADIKVLKEIVSGWMSPISHEIYLDIITGLNIGWNTERCRERDEALEKLQRLGVVEEEC
jgi:thymidylate synthase (FAD)